jgi:hypothetical protein
MLVLPPRVSMCCLSGDSVLARVESAVTLVVLDRGVVDAVVGLGLVVA